MHHSQLLFSCVHFQSLKVPRYAAVPPSLACVQLRVRFKNPGSVLRYVALFVLVTAEYDSMAIGVVLPLPPHGCANDQ